jgi:hypothetical protein
MPSVHTRGVSSENSSWDGQRCGFRDSDSRYGQNQELPPTVTLFNLPMTYGYGSTYVTVAIGEEVVLPYEWIVDDD